VTATASSRSPRRGRLGGNSDLQQPSGRAGQGDGSHGSSESCAGSQARTGGPLPIARWNAASVRDCCNHSVISAVSTKWAKELTARQVAADALIPKGTCPTVVGLTLHLLLPQLVPKGVEGAHLLQICQVQAEEGRWEGRAWRWDGEWLETQISLPMQSADESYEEVLDGTGLLLGGILENGCLGGRVTAAVGRWVFIKPARRNAGTLLEVCSGIGTWGWLATRFQSCSLSSSEELGPQGKGAG
jgi:hypothetical protein